MPVFRDFALKPDRRKRATVVGCKLSSSFLCKASEQSGFSESIIRMQCDHTKEPYSETVFHRCDEQAQKKAEMRLRKQAARLGFQLLPVPATAE
jgi:hypothetical protein